MEKIDTKSIIRIVAALIVGLAVSPLIISLVSDAQPYDYTTYQTLNSGFTDNDSDNCPAYWENTDTGQDNALWSQPGGYVYDNAENGTLEWYQLVTVSSLHDKISSATIRAKFKLYENDNLEYFSARVYLDDGTDNHIIWEDNTLENMTTYISIENDISSYITAAGTYYIRFSDNASVGGDGSPISGNLQVRWDDASLVVVAGTETYTAAMLFAHLLPLFFIIGLVLAVVYWIKSK